MEIDGNKRGKQLLTQWSFDRPWQKTTATLRLHKK